MPHDKVTDRVLKFEGKEDGHILILKNFTRHLLFGEELIAPGEEGINSLRISNAAYVSGWLDETVDVPADEKLFSRLLYKKRMSEKSTKRKLDNGFRTEESDGEYSDRWSVRW